MLMIGVVYISNERLREKQSMSESDLFKRVSSGSSDLHSNEFFGQVFFLAVVLCDVQLLNVVCSGCESSEV